MDRDTWLKLAHQASTIRDVRPEKTERSVGEAMGYVREIEADGKGGIVRARTYFLVGSECRFTCSMCDLWKYTLEARQTPFGSLVSQVDSLHRAHDQGEAREGGGVVGGREWLKLYNAANFFDDWNVSSEERVAIANRCKHFDRVVVENHAAMLQTGRVRDEVLRFRDSLVGELEIALGLETIEPESMRILNKGLRLEQFQSAVEFLRGEGVHCRAFVLLGPPGVLAGESVYWAKSACAMAVAWGVERCCVIPTRGGNGWLDLGRRHGYWSPPSRSELERVQEELLRDNETALVGEVDVCRETGGKIESHRTAPFCVQPVYTVDLWDWDLLDRGNCESSACHSIRRERMSQMNMQQRWISWGNRQSCHCGESERNHD